MELVALMPEGEGVRFPNAEGGVGFLNAEGVELVSLMLRGGVRFPNAEGGVGFLNAEGVELASLMLRQGWIQDFLIGGVL